jgi:cell wall-associated NlpC family hydrolase
VVVRVSVDGSFVTSVQADQPSPEIDSSHHLTGNHAYSVTISRTTWAHTVTARSRGVVAGAPLTTVGTHTVAHYYPPPGVRIIDIAKKYVGDRYVEGGASPAGFDCSGYTLYAYAHARVKQLPHNAESQRQGMRVITHRAARPGDLVFYMSGGSAYHVAIYAGHGWQYAAATPRDGVRYQRVWSPYVRFGTDWH